MAGMPVSIDPKPRAPVVPFINGTLSNSILIDGAGGTNYTPSYVRVSVEPGGDVPGAQQLLDATCEATIWLGEARAFSFSAPVRDLYLIGVAESATDVDTFTDYSCLITTGEVDLADVLAHMRHVRFSEADNVRTVVIRVSPAIGTYNARVIVEGYSHD